MALNKNEPESCDSINIPTKSVKNIAALVAAVLALLGVGGQYAGFGPNKTVDQSQVDLSVRSYMEECIEEAMDEVDTKVAKELEIVAAQNSTMVLTNIGISRRAVDTKLEREIDKMSERIARIVAVVKTAVAGVEKSVILQIGQTNKDVARLLEENKDLKLRVRKLEEQLPFSHNP